MIKSLANNYLQVDFSSVLNYQCLVRISDWHNKGVTWSIEYEDETVNPDFQSSPGIPLKALVNDELSNPWKDSFPATLLGKLLDYESSYQGSVYPALWLVSRSLAAKQLFESAPLLFWLVMKEGEAHGWEEVQIERVFYFKRVDILGLCGLPKSNSILKFLNKLSFSRMTHQMWQHLELFMASDYFKSLRHVKYADFDLIQFINKNPQMRNAAFIQNYQQTWNWAQFKQIFDDTLRLELRLNPNGQLECIKRCKDYEELLHLHDALTIKTNQKNIAEIVNYDYPKPLKAGNSFIVPITQSKELFMEGQVMHHCVYSYDLDIFKGNISIYKVLEPERATLSIKKTANGDYLIDQFKLKYNNEPSKQSKEQVAKWLYNE